MKFGLRELMFVLLLAAIPVGAWWFVFKPRNVRIADDNQQIQAKRAKLTALNRATSTMGSAKADIEELNKAIEFFQSKLPPEKEMDKVVEEVSKLAEGNGLATTAIRTLKRNPSAALTDPDGPYAEQPVSMEFEGSFKGLYSFLLALEKKPRIIRIHQMRLEKPAKGEDGTMKAMMVTSIFYEHNIRKE